MTLEKRLQSLPQESWQPTVDRARRNIDRLLEMQYQVYDIIQNKTYKTRTILSQLLNQCRDELEAVIAEQFGEGSIVEHIREYIDETYGTKELIAEAIELAVFVNQRLEYLKPYFAHREIEVLTRLNDTPAVNLPADALQKIFDGLLKNAIENTPDEGRIEIVVKMKGDGTLLQIRDFGVGITMENQIRIFEGFFTTRETMDYSSKKPFDFNAGGKGADLLRMKIFSERYGFKIDLKSTRCSSLPHNSDVCPGRISACAGCRNGHGCHQAAATTFSLYFPPPAASL
jgi:signal transduction histidine kinase